MQIEILDQKKIDYEIRQYDPEAKSAAEAAKEMDFPVSLMLKSLLLRSGSDFYLFLIPSTAKLDLEKIDRALHTKLEMANTNEITEQTGYGIGFVTPFGLNQPITIFLERSVITNRVVSVASGVRGYEVVLNPMDLQQATGALVSDLVDRKE